MMAGEIVLALNQSAEPGQCGSCHFFFRDPERNEWNVNGRCKFRLPPTRTYSKREWSGEEQPLDTVNDTDGCDFWRHTGKTYIVSRRIKPT
jgi:hypothetical protein